MSESRHLGPAEQVLQAVAVAAWTAVPDYAPGPWGRRAARGAVLAASTGAFLLLDRHRAEEDEPEETPSEQHPALTATLVAGGLLGSVGAHVGGKRVSRSIVRRLESRGVRRPWTVVGVGTGAVTLALAAAEGRLRRPARA